MKKLICAAVAAMLLVVVLAVSVNAAEAPKAELVAGVAYQGEILSVDVILSASNVTAVGVFEIEYDSDLMEWTGGEWSDLSGITLGNIQLAQGTASCAFSPASDLSGKVLTLTFKVKADAEVGKTVNVNANVRVVSDGVKKDYELVGTTKIVEGVCKHVAVEVEDAKYLKQARSCTSAAEYWKSCSSCGEKLSSTFTVGEPLPHTFTESVIKDVYKKYSATCTRKAAYYKSCKCGEKGTEFFETGEKLEHSYTIKAAYETFKKNDASCTEALTYYLSCSCGRKGEETFTVGQALPHSFTERVELDEYKKNDASCTEKLTYYTSCACGAKGTDIFVVGDVLAHTYSEMIMSEAYLKSVATCTEKAVYYKSCKCGAKGEETFEDNVATGHTYGSEWKTDADAHWYECTVCGDKKDQTAHAFDNACDTDCNVCGYTRTITHNYSTEAKSDAEGHWYECTVCGDKKDKATHAFDNDCDTDCNTCGYGRETSHVFDNDCDTACNVCGDTREIVHSYKTEWSKNDAEHWHECQICGAKGDLKAHGFDGGVVTTEPTTENEGVKTYTCGDCGATKTESVAKLEKKGGCSSSKSGGLALISLFICAQAGVFFKKRRS